MRGVTAGDIRGATVGAIRGATVGDIANDNAAPNAPPKSYIIPPKPNPKVPIRHRHIVVCAVGNAFLEKKRCLLFSHLSKAQEIFTNTHTRWPDPVSAPTTSTTTATLANVLSDTMVSLVFLTHLCQ